MFLAIQCCSLISTAILISLYAKNQVLFGLFLHFIALVVVLFIILSSIIVKLGRFGLLHLVIFGVVSCKSIQLWHFVLLLEAHSLGKVMGVLLGFRHVW